MAAFFEPAVAAAVSIIKALIEESKVDIAVSMPSIILLLPVLPTVQTENTNRRQYISSAASQRVPTSSPNFVND